MQGACAGNAASRAAVAGGTKNNTLQLHSMAPRAPAVSSVVDLQLQNQSFPGALANLSLAGAGTFFALRMQLAGTECESKGFA
jgi:hypothetical protein